MRAPWLLVVGFFLLALVAFFPTAVFRGDVFYCRDQAGLMIPLWHYARERLLSGEWPLWFPYDGLGAPMLGSTVAGLFNPFFWLVLPLETSTALKVLTLILFGVAFFATYRVAIHLACPTWAALVAATTYAFSGSVVTLVDNTEYQFGAALYPVAVLGITRALAGARKTGVVLGASALAGMILGGDLQSAYATGLTALALCLVLPSSTDRALQRGAIALALLGIAGALAAAQLVPSFEMFRAGARAGGLSFLEATEWSFHPLRIPELFLGDFIRWDPGSDTVNAVREQLIGSTGLWSATVTLGPLALWGSIIALRTSDRASGRCDWGLAATGGLLLWIATGRYGGAYRVAGWLIPLWSAFRIPEKWVVFASLPLSLLAARGLGRLAQPAQGSKIGRTLGVGLAAMVGGLAATALAAAAVSSPAWTQYLQRASQGGALAAGVGALLLLPLRWKPYAVFALPWVALAGVWLPNHVPVDQCLVPAELAQAPSPVADYLSRTDGPSLGRYRTAFASPLSHIPRVRPELWPNPSSEARLAVFKRQALFPDQGAAFHIETAGRYLPGMTDAFDRLERQVGLPAVLRLFNTRYLITDPTEPPSTFGPDARAVSTFDELSMSLVRLDGALPRAFVATPVAAEDLQSAIVLVRDDPAILAGTRAVIQEAGAAHTGPAVQGSVTVESYSPESVGLTAEVDREAVVVLNDGFDLSWSATVDGEPAPIHRTNILVRGVVIPPGRHQVRFQMRSSRATRTGMAVSAFSFFAVLVALTLRARPRPNHPARASPADIETSGSSDPGAQRPSS